LQSLNKVASAAKRQRAEFIRQAGNEANCDAYLRQPDSAAEANDWGNAEEWKAWAVRNVVEPAGRRPVLWASRDDAYGVLNRFVAAEITATIRHIPIEIPLGKTEGMLRPCVVNCDGLRTISKVHRVERISRIPTRRIVEVKRAVGYALVWEELIESNSEVPQAVSAPSRR
jgi:mRNA-degrading endonuclease toxin of MazEF toxin-antitoxin module